MVLLSPKPAYLQVDSYSVIIWATENKIAINGSKTIAVKMAASRDAASCSLVDINRRFRRI
jgi:hypothetical protein